MGLKLISAITLFCIFFSFCSAGGERETEKAGKKADNLSYEKKRAAMVKSQIEAHGIDDQHVLEAMRKVPRHLFVAERYRQYAYGDHPLPIAENQTISQPYIVAAMTAAVELEPTDRVLEIGTGSGYQAAILGEIAKEVFSVEIKQVLAENATHILQELGYKNVKVKHADGFYGWPGKAPFDVIIITAAAERVPPPLVEQLAEGGRLIVPLGRTDFYQTLTLFKKKDGKLEKKLMIEVRFVPMTGKIKEKK